MGTTAIDLHYCLKNNKLKDYTPYTYILFLYIYGPGLISFYSKKIFFALLNTLVKTFVKSL